VTNRRRTRTIALVSEALKGTAEPTRQLVRRPRFQVALYTGCGALFVLLIGSWFDQRPARTFGGHLIVTAPTVVFLLLGILCVRATGHELDEFFRWRGGQTAGSAIRMMVTVLGYLLTILGALDMMSVPLGHLLVGGAVAGILIGIAAQQSLGNMFAGLVLLMARPFAVGNHIRIRSGALGGEFHGTVFAMSLTYVSVRTPEGVLKVPNSSVLASAVGPFRQPDDPVGNTWGQTRHGAASGPTAFTPDDPDRNPTHRPG
jgi:small-conductance mechanosensitive channel